MIDEVNTFLDLYKNSGAEIIYAVVTNEKAVESFINDTGKIAFLTRRLTQAENEQVSRILSVPNELIIAYDGIAVIVNSKNNIKQITTTEIQKILNGTITKWEQLSSAKPVKGMIQIFLQDSSDITTYLSKRLALQDGIKAGFTQTNSDIKTIASVEAAPLSIGFTSLSWIDSVKANIKVLEVGRTKEDTDTTFAIPQDAVGKFYSPDAAYIYLNYYPFKRAIYMYTYAKVNLAMGFGTFVSTAEGQKLFLKRGLLPGTQKIKLRGM
jgi:phosphate transport system substrate-binding protein